MKNRRFINSMKYAMSGIIHFLKSEPNSRLHFLAILIVISAGLWFKISHLSWVGVLLCIGLVWCAEMFNTAIEKAMDIISPGKSEQVRLIKDLAAGAVLTAAIIAVITGVVIFMPYMIQLL